MFKLAPKGPAVQVALVNTHPHSVQLPLEAVPQEHCSVLANVGDVLHVLGGKQLLL